MKNQDDLRKGFMQPKSAVIEIAPPNNSTTVFISDVHWPYEDKRAVSSIIKYIQDKKPNHVVLGGDIFDCYNVSDFDRDPDRFAINLQKEFDSAKEAIDEIAKNCKHLSFILGNHENRIWRLIIRNPALYDLRALDFKTISGLPEKAKVYPYLTKIKEGSIYYHHGDIANQNTAKSTFGKFSKSMIVGHSHRMDAYYHTDGLTGEHHCVLVNGTLSDFEQARFVDCANWQKSIITIDHYEINKQKLFDAKHRLIINNSMYVNGKVYKG